MKATDELATLLRQAKRLAARYYALTGRPLGVTGEVAESEVIRLLGLELAPVRTAGYDVIRRLPHGAEQHLQVKGRVIPTAKKQRGQRMGAINAKHPCDGVLLVLMNENFDATAIFEAPWAKIAEAFARPGGKARTERGALAVSQFRRIAHQVWPPMTA